MENCTVFDVILDQNENILKIFRPNKLRYIFINFIWYFFLLTILSAILFATFYFADAENNKYGFYLPLFIAVGFDLFFSCLILISYAIRYQKTYYALTNKRVIIRTGIIGIDYQTLDIKMIGAINVYVSLLDKLVKPNTGKIVIGSTSAPVNNARQSNFNFYCVDNPYDTYRQIKETIDANRAKNK